MNFARSPLFKRSLYALFLAAPCTVAAVVAGCGDDDVNAVSQDAGGSDATPTDGAGGDAAPSDAGADAAAMVARGQYLVDHVAACSDCHTPRLATGAPDMTKYLAGAECFLDVNGAADGGCVNSRNLTNDATGLKNRSDAEIKAMFMEGKRPDGKFLAPVMPYYVFHNFTNEDADAIVAYLRTVPAVEHTVGVSDPPFDNIPAPATAIDMASVPAADGGANENGRYLATIACLECHSPDLPPGAERPIDITKGFAGGRQFPAAALHLPSPPFPDTIYSANLTPHATGLAGWTAADIQKVIKEAKDRDGGGICPPMPAGPMGAFGGLTDKDITDIATYIANLPPIDNTIPNGNGSCVSP